jgi:hypothetical protein
MPATNVVTFFGVPFDPPGAGSHTFRVTNIRADAAFLGVSPGPLATQIQETIAIAGPGQPVSVTITNPVQTVAYVINDLLYSVPTPTPTTSTVHVQEGFASSFKPKNLSFTVGNGGPGNANFNGSFYDYNGGTGYPPDLAQNVPGVFYNTESGLEWTNNGVNGPPSPNPPQGFLSSSLPNIGNPFFSPGLGFQATQIEQAGVVNQGARIALTFAGLKGNHHVTVPQVVYLHKLGTPAVNSGVLVLTQTDVAGLGTFTPTTGASTPAGNLAVYEVLWADPFAVEYADIPCTYVGGGPAAKVNVSVGFAPFYPTSAAPANPPIPRFVPVTTSIPLF